MHKMQRIQVLKEVAQFHRTATRGNVGRVPYLITDQHMDACGALLEDLADLSRRNIEELRNLLSQLHGRQILQINCMVH